MKYIRERERLLGATGRTTNSKDGAGVGEVLKKNREDSEGKEKTDGEWEDAEDVKEQKVYVLHRGFVGWQERFAEDTRLTEGYRKEIWRDGYWM